MRAIWRVILDGATDEALLAVDLYNQPRQPRRLEGFLVQMHIAWLYLLQAEFKRDGVRPFYKLPNGRYEKVDDERKTWDLRRMVKERWPDGGPVSTNLEFSIGLRNKVEHRYNEAIALATSGYAQALLVNFEEELTTAFGSEFSLGNRLRFPIFAGAITALGQAEFRELHSELPRDTRDFIASFEADLDPAITSDQRYEFRINLVPKLGPKTEADTALTFVREDELTDAERATLAELGRTGRVVVRERTHRVVGAGLTKPSEAAELIEDRIPFEFKVHHVVRAWKKLGCRSSYGDAHPERTDERYCIYDQPHSDYLYTPAFVDKVACEVGTAEKFEAFTELEPQPK